MGFGGFGGLNALRVLDLNRSAITDVCLSQLSACSGLTTIVLDSCYALTDVSPVVQMKSLEKVSLRDCQNVGDSAGTLSALPQLRDLDLSHTLVTDVSVNHLGSSLSIVRLYLESCKHLTDISPLQHIPTLEVLSICSCRGVSRGVGNLGRLCHLLELDARETGITSECLYHLCRSSSLVKLLLDCCLSLNDVSPLTNLPTLEELSVCDCLEVQKGIETLATLPRLRSLRLKGAQLTDDFVRRAASASTFVEIRLYASCCLTDASLFLNFNALEELHLDGCNAIENIGTLGRLQKLRVLSLSNTKVTDKQLFELSCSQSLVRLDLECCRLLTTTVPLVSLQSLEIVKLNNCNIVKCDTGCLGKLSRLRELYLRDIGITKEELCTLGESRTLVKVDLESNDGITDVSALSMIRTLEEINLRYCPDVDEGVGALGSLPLLRELNVSSTAVKDSCILGLSHSCSIVRLNLTACNGVRDIAPIANIDTLEELVLDACAGVSDSGIGALGKLPKLRLLHAACVPVTSDGLRGLGSSPRLVELVLDTCVEITDVTPLTRIHTLETLSLNSCVSLTVGVHTLATLPRLRSLNLRAVPVDDKVLALLRSEGVRLLR
ncbi:leucine-rich repeat protein (LRRP) [Trypanosoma vivax Y486]|uniref:Leucine-rich repeat protein (LRRP) n=1 Tax=Trypanosoma vivax (strain Y486) TaxID=1055687 RepID=F9WRY8_TRYVY|nr:leucine-rich repeat protein (LRRP) [Trypanosoma vivax Y486]|eukprot:CCD20324.1 leucine-rich repeat protein (LRRP) [Trypanosoma vivax Y486]